MREKGDRKIVLDVHRELLEASVRDASTMEFTLAVRRGSPSLRLDEWLGRLFGADPPLFEVTRTGLWMEPEERPVETSRDEERAVR